jgi:hypothetical protein
MKRSEKIITGFIIGSTFPLLLALLSGVIWFFLDGNESRVLLYVISGFLLGFIMDVGFLKKWIDKRYELPVWFIAGIYLFYNICIYGMFMGFPVFNVAMGIMAGYYYGNRIYYNNTRKNATKPDTSGFVIHGAGHDCFLYCIRNYCTDG